MLKRLSLCIISYILLSSLTTTQALITNKQIEISGISIAVGAGGVVVVKKIFANHARPPEDMKFAKLQGVWEEVHSSWENATTDLARSPNIVIKNEPVSGIRTPEQLRELLIKEGFSDGLAYRITSKMHQGLVTNTQQVAMKRINSSTDNITKHIGNPGDWEYIIKRNNAIPTVEVKLHDAPVYELSSDAMGMKQLDSIDISHTYYPPLDDEFVSDIVDDLS